MSANESHEPDRITGEPHPLVPAGAPHPPSAAETGERPATAENPPWANGKLTPEVRQWALQQFTEEEIAEGLRELRERGGVELRDFLSELEQMATRP